MLYFVATPIGNLQDITLRALEVLKNVSAIAVEDKRVAIKLLDHYQIKKPLLVWQQHSTAGDWQKIKNILSRGEDMAALTDAGTPGLSDPGGRLIELVHQELPQVQIVPIPGASSLTSIISVAGIPLDRFTFLGFLPHKKGRQTIIEEIKQAKYPMIFLESVHRIEKTLEQLSDCPKEIIMGRELTKQFETIYRGTAQEILEILNKDKKQIKGEFIVIVNK